MGDEGFQTPDILRVRQALSDAVLWRGHAHAEIQPNMLQSRPGDLTLAKRWSPDCTPSATDDWMSTTRPAHRCRHTPINSTPRLVYQHLGDRPARRLPAAGSPGTPLSLDHRLDVEAVRLLGEARGKK